MKKILLSMVLLLAMTVNVNATDVKTLSWAKVCSGKMEAAWYGSDEAKGIADIVLEVQKETGGWMKNDQLHKLSASDLARLKAERNEHSCLDNTATTQEMRFLAKVYQATKVEKYRTAFNKALNMIFASEKACGGWSQYWPLSGNGSYQDYITFNDDLITNVLKILRDIHNNKGDFADIVDEQTRERCMTSFDKTIEMIIKCQIDDNGTKAAWCAQHDTIDLLPTEGRPHELPSVSGSESANLLSFLMTIEKPSEELQTAISAAVTWLGNHKIEGKAIEEFVNANGQRDRRIIDKPGSAIWGRFIQLGGASGKKVYDKFFKKLRDRGKKRTYEYNGKDYTYTEYEMATSSYQESKAYQPIFSIYSNEYPHLYYRFLYNYDDTDPVVDGKGLPIATSLMAGNRVSYQYLGSWCQNVIENEYPAWKKRIEAQNAEGNGSDNELSATTYGGQCEVNGETILNFSNGYKVGNVKGKGYGTGKSNTVKYSATDYVIYIPKGQKVTKVSFFGYDNYDVDAYLRNVNGVSYDATDYVFPAKHDVPVYVTHTLDLGANPAEGKLTFTIGAKQCCLVITLYSVSSTGVEHVTTILPSTMVGKYAKCGHVVIQKGNTKYTVGGQRLE